MARPRPVAAGEGQRLGRRLPADDEHRGRGHHARLRVQLGLRRAGAGAHALALLRRALQRRAARLATGGKVIKC